MALIFDLDKFKHINDTYGHVFGDTVLKSFANTIDTLKPQDAIAGRYGGDEFVIITPTNSMEEVKTIAKMIQKDTRALLFEEEPEVKLTTSIGITMYTGVEDVTALYKNADCVLYTIKRRGGDGYGVYCNGKIGS